MRRRQAAVGPNQIEHARRQPLWRLLFDQFRDFMVIVLILAAVVSGVIGEAIDALAILTIVIVNAIIGCVQQ